MYKPPKPHMILIWDRIKNRVKILSCFTHGEFIYTDYP